MQKLVSSFLVALTTLFFFSCSVNKAKIDNELKKFYSDNPNTEGCFTMLDNATGEITVYNMAMDTLRVSPASTFNIPLSLIALQTGAVTDEKMKIQSDSSNPESGLNIVEAFKQNSFASFEKVANDIDKDTLNAWISRLSYGVNTSKAKTDSIWMNNDLKISPDEQLGLLKRLYFDMLPFRKSVQLSVREMMVQEDNSAYKLSYCSGGTKSENNEDLFWSVGWVEENRHVYFFVSLEKSKNTQSLKTDKLGVARKILAHYGFFKGAK